MRTTLDIDYDVLAAAKSLAAQRQLPLGKVVSELERQTLMRRPEITTRNGVPLLPIKQGASPVTMEMVNGLRDDEQ